LPGIEPVTETCAAAVADPMLLATDVVDYLVQKGVAFREAHHVVGSLVALAEKSGSPLNELPQKEVSKIHLALENDWTEVFDLDRALAAREATGMPGPKTVAAQLEAWKERL
jgi:argininosuccinate lyase